MHSPAHIAFSALVYALIFASVLVWGVIVRRLRARQPLVPLEPRLAVPWNGIDVFALLVAMIYGEFLAASLTRVGESAEPPAISPATLAAAGGARLAWLLLAVVYLTARRGAFLDDLGLKTDKLASDVRLGLATFVAAVLPVYGLQLLFTQWFEIPSKHPIVEFTLAHDGVASLLLASFVAAIVAPLAEEFLFRVLLQGWLEKKQVGGQHASDGATISPGLGPATVVSLLFALMHWGHGPDPIALFVLSLFLGYLYERTHRIVAPLVVHFCVNSLAVIQLWVTWAAGSPGS